MWSVFIRNWASFRKMNSLLSQKPESSSFHVRKKLVKWEYPLPWWGKPVGWCFFFCLTAVCTALILLFGLYFDVKVSASEDPLSKYLASSCGNGLDISEQARINHSMQRDKFWGSIIIIFVLDLTTSAIENFTPAPQYPENDTSYPKDMSDTPRWLTTITVSLLQSVIIWQS